MKVLGKPMRSIWVEADGWSIGVIDQTRLPHHVAKVRLTAAGDAARAIRGMLVRCAEHPSSAERARAGA
jgi:methylthioribose-1-phosphate isomerase